MNTLHIGKLKRRALCCLVFFSLVGTVGCASGRKNIRTPISAANSSQANSAVSSPGAGGSLQGNPPGTQDTNGTPLQNKEPAYGPEPVAVRPIELVLGPGLARGFAHIGVIHALNTSKIPIGRIYAAEMGALVGTIYAVNPNINPFEWNLLKFKASLFSEKKGFFARFDRSSTSSEPLEKTLNQVFGGKNLTQTKIPILIAVQSSSSHQIHLVSQGLASDVVRAALSRPDLFPPKKIPLASLGMEIDAIAATDGLADLIHEARQQGNGPVVVIDVRSKQNTALESDQVKGADFVIAPDLKGIDEMDFQKKTDAAFQGKNAIIQNTAELRKLVGLQ